MPLDAFRGGNPLERVVADSYTGLNGLWERIRFPAVSSGTRKRPILCPPEQSGVAAATERQFGKGLRQEFLKDRIKSRTRERRSSNLVNNRSSSSAAQPYHSAGI